MSGVELNENEKRKNNNGFGLIKRDNIVEGKAKTCLQQPSNNTIKH